MARSMIKRRQKAKRERLEAYNTTLRQVAAQKRPPPDFARALDEVKCGFAGDMIRDCWSWRPKMKTRNAAKLRLAAARHCYARYAVPSSLEEVWCATGSLNAEEVRLRKRWYIIAAQGRSLWKERARRWLTRKEVHWFLNPPGDLTFEEAFWQAIARSYSGDVGLALRIARSKIGRSPRSQIDFWREAARFFAVNPVSLEEIDDFCDFLAAIHRCDKCWSVKGRTLASLTRLANEWHRDVAMVARIEAARIRAERRANGGNSGPASRGGRWCGSPLVNWQWKPSAKKGGKAREEYVVAQLVTADSLVVESWEMRHCVWTYASKCITGNASIWSLRYHADGRMTRLLTIELDRQNRAVQVRGHGNRVARPDERKVLERWAKARGVALLA